MSAGFVVHLQHVFKARPERGAVRLMQTVAQGLANQVETAFADRGLQQRGALNVVNRACDRQQPGQRGAHLCRFHFKIGDGRNHPDFIRPAAFDGQQVQKFIIRISDHAGHHQPAQTTRRQVVAVIFVMHRVAEKICFRQLLAAQGFVN